MKSVANHPLQSKEWAEFRKAWGNEVWETQFGILTLHRITYTKFKIGMFIKGPAPTKVMLEWLKAEGLKQNIIFIKLEPNVAFGDNRMKNVASSMERIKLTKILKENGCVLGKTLFTPTTFWIDLTRSEDEIFKSFSSKTRYNIRLAQKHGVQIIADDSDKAFGQYLELMRETVNRQGFYAHSEKYHRLMWDHLNTSLKTKNEKPIARLLTAIYKGEIITAWIVFVYGDFLYYPYGASSEKYKNLMPSNLIMWEAIRYGRNLKLKTFDLWGREPGKGFTKFKEGYNPQVVEFLGTWDLVINKPLYKIYRSLENIRWKILRARTRFGLIKPSF